MLPYTEKDGIGCGEVERKDFKKYFRKRMIELKESKPFVASLTLLSAVCVIAAGTYAFTSYTEWVKNHFQSNGSALDVRIVEVFDEEVVVPNVDITKEVKVKNTSSFKGLIRVKLDESFLPFELDMTDQTGNANLKTTTVSTNTIERDDLDTWKVNYSYDSGLTDTNKNELYYIATNPSDTVSLTDVIQQPVGYQLVGTKDSAKRNDFISNIITINFNDTNVFSTAPTSSTTGDYWLYDNTTGYFYYSRVLDGNEMTDTSLITGLTAASQISNAYKGALYKLNVTAEGVYANEGGLTSWVTSGDVFNMLITQLDN